MLATPQQHTVSVADLELTTVPAQQLVLNADKQVLTDFGHQGRVTALQVWEGSSAKQTNIACKQLLDRDSYTVQVKQWGDGNVMVVVGSAQGGVSRMRFKVPLAPGSALAEIQASLPLCYSAFSQCLLPSFDADILHSHMHTCACMQMVDMESDTHEGCLTVWQHCHTDDVAAVDINTDKQQVSCVSGLHMLYQCRPFCTKRHICTQC